jgi:hypothetical protein
MRKYIQNKKGIFDVFAPEGYHPSGPFTSRLGPCPAVEDFLEIAPVFWGGPLIVTTILAPSVVLGALAARFGFGCLSCFSS